MTQEVERIADQIVEALSKMQPGWMPSPKDLEKAKRTGVLVTPDGYKLSWSQSLGWVVQLPLAFLEIRVRTP